MAYWLMKSEPDELSIERLAQLNQTCWDGVRNYQARNFIRTMQPGDLFFFYHSSCAVPGIAGVAKIITQAYPDPTALDPHSPYHDPKACDRENPWLALDVAHERTFPGVVSLGLLKQQAALETLALVKKGSRLSVMPVTPEQWAAVLGLVEAS